MRKHTDTKFIKSFQGALLKLRAALHPTRSLLPFFMGTLALLLAVGIVVAGGFYSQGHSALALGALLSAVILSCELGGYRIASEINDLRNSGAMLSQWRQLFFNAQWGIALVSAYDRKLLLFNPAFATMHGGERVELLGCTVDTLYAPAYKDELAFNLVQVLERGHCRFEAECVSAGGNRISVLIDGSAVKTAQGFTGFIVLNVLDISERRLAEQRLRESEFLLAQAQAQVRLGSWRLDVAQDRLEWSEECRRIFAAPSDARLTYQRFLDAVHPDDRNMVNRSWQEALQGMPYDIQHRIVVGGETLWVREIAELEFSADGEICVGVGTVQDITDMKLKELELLRSRAMIRELAAHNERIREEERRRISRELHDEMGQWLTALRLDAAMLQMRIAPDDHQFDETLCDMKSSIDNMIKVVRDIASSARPEALDAGLVPAAQWLLTSFQERTGVSCTIHCDPEMTADTLELDEPRTVAAFRILQESLTNVARHASATEVSVSMARDDEEFTMSIRDNGVGFDPRVVREETGFGLMGMRERALIFGGISYIESRPHKGTRVSVRIPLRTSIKA
ncbi:MAG: PAS domain S-box protein [Gammaproteobacteria bacterium]|nr:PAS domain S-box protein [Gammaproteobacteria bacterium]